MDDFRGNLGTGMSGGLGTGMGGMATGMGGKSANFTVALVLLLP